MGGFALNISWDKKKEKCSRRIQTGEQCPHRYNRNKHAHNWLFEILGNHVVNLYFLLPISNFSCTLCKGSAGRPGDKHSRTTCPKLVRHGVSSSLKLCDLENLGACSVLSLRHNLRFQATFLISDIPREWHHVLITYYFAAPLGCSNDLSIVFQVSGIDTIGDEIFQTPQFVLLDVLVKKFKSCMNTYQ